MHVQILFKYWHNTFCFHTLAKAQAKIIIFHCQMCENSKNHTKMWIHLQMLLHGINQIPARQKHQHRSRDIEGLNVLEQSLNEFKRGFLFIQLCHAHPCFWTILITTDQVAICLQKLGNIFWMVSITTAHEGSLRYVLHIQVTPNVLINSSWLVRSAYRSSLISKNIEPTTFIEILNFSHDLRMGNT